MVTYLSSFYIDLFLNPSKYLLLIGITKFINSFYLYTVKYIILIALEIEFNYRPYNVYIMLYGNYFFLIHINAHNGVLK